MRSATLTLCAAILATTLSVTAAGKPLVPVWTPDHAEQYSAATALMLAGSYREAAAAYERMLAKEQDLGMADQVLWMLGNCRLGLKDYEGAIRVYEDLARRRPASPWAARALLSAGDLCEAQVNDPSRARTFYERVRDAHGQSPLAAEAHLAIARTWENEGRYEEAVKVYAEVESSTTGLVAEKAGERRRFIDANGDGAALALGLYDRAIRLSRRVETQNEALLELIRLTGSYPDSPLADDALAAMVRVYLLRKDGRAARQAFDRLVASRPQELRLESVRAIAPAAAGWLLGDVDKEINTAAEVFPELAGYAAHRELSSPSQNPDRVWRLEFESNGGSGGQRDLVLTVTAGRTTDAAKAPYPNLGLEMAVDIRTNSEVLKTELARSLGQMQRILDMLEQSANARAVVETAP